MTQMVLLQKRFQLVKDEGDKLVKKQQRAEQKEELAAEDHVAIAASTEQVRQHFMSLRELTSGMIFRGEDILTARIGLERSREEKQCTEVRETHGAPVLDPMTLPHAAADTLRDSLLQHDPDLLVNVQRTCTRCSQELI